MAIGLGIASLVLAVGGTVASTTNRNRDIADQKAVDALNASNLKAEGHRRELKNQTRELQDCLRRMLLL